MQMQVRATNPGILTNTASVTGGSRDLNPDNNTDSEKRLSDGAHRAEAASPDSYDSSP